MSQEFPKIKLPGIPSGIEVMQSIAAESDTVLLAFSCGKDSIAAWLGMRPHFKKIIPFYMYLVPGLEFVERSLVYYEQFFGCHIHRLPHPSLYRMLSSLVFQPPQNAKIIEAAGLGAFTYDQMRGWLCDDLGLPTDTFYASGVRAADSPNRRMAMKTHGPINRNRHLFYPIWDMRKDELVELLRQHSIKMPEDYRYFGRSFDGIDHRFLRPIKDHFPDDYQRILEVFPLAELILFRAECSGELDA